MAHPAEAFGESEGPPSGSAPSARRIFRRKVAIFAVFPLQKMRAASLYLAGSFLKRQNLQLLLATFARSKIAGNESMA